jgi:CRP-like cAMP-binding protein
MKIEQLLEGYVRDRREVPSGSVIIMEGRKTEWIFMLLKGQAKVKQKTAAGTVTLDILREGSIIGEMSLLGDSLGVASASVVADGPINLAVLDRDALLKDFQALSPQLRETVSAILRRLKEATEEVNVLAGLAA